ncbi:MAG: PKD domain-containing protein [Acidobacteriota bacterium]|nr:PKD domain-containing protein [Acidobacteriota bacterium]
MKTSRIWIAALCCMTLAGSSRLSAAGSPPANEQREIDARMISQGWKPVATGVYERQRGAQKTEHMGYGREGLLWAVGELTRQLGQLTGEFQRYPSEDLAKVIDTLREKIARAQNEVRNTKAFANLSEDATGGGCSICYGATADAYPLSGASGQGVGAIADAKFNSSCGLSGDTYAYAYARATLNGTTTTHTQEDPHTGTSVTSHAAASVNGASNCLSTANSYAQSTALGITYSTSSSNSSCPLPAPTITGPAAATLAGTSCQTLTWSATTNGGAPPFTYAWTIDGAAAGTSTSTSVSKTYCGDNTAHSQTVNVGLTLTDSTSSSASASTATTLTYTAASLAVAITGPTYVAGNICRTVTWSSTVSGGTSPYTYAWTVDGSPVGTSSSASVSQTFCSSETASVALSVNDIYSRSGSATYSTTISLSGGSGCGGNPCP